MLLLLLACQPDTTSTSAQSAAAWLGEVDTYIQLGQPDAPAEPPYLILRVEEDSWTLREGEDWTTGTELAVMEVDTSDGLVVGGERLLPDRPAEGESQDGAEVLSIGTAEVYYGSFEQALTVSVTGGRWAGEQIFGEGFGLISTTFDGEQWELVYYE